MQVILLERIEKLGQMGELVNVKTGYARNYLLPQGKAMRATKDNMARFDLDRGQIEAASLERRGEAEALASTVEGLTCVLLRQASDGAQLYGSVTARDIADAAGEAGVTLDRKQVQLDRPIKTLGIHPIRVTLHPEVIVGIRVNIARTAEEAEMQLAAESGAEVPSDEVADAEAVFDAADAAEESEASTESGDADGAAESEDKT